MFRHNLFDLLKTFSTEENKRFNDFIISPYFYKGKKIVKLFNEIIKYYPSFTHKELTRKNLSNIVYSNLANKDSTLNKLIHELNKLVIKFIVLERFNNMKYTQYDYLLKELTYRNQIKLFKAYIEKIEVDMNDKNGIDPEYLNNRYTLEVDKFNFSRVNEKTTKKLSAYEELKELMLCSEYFIIYSITEIINEYMVMYFGRSKFNIDCDKNTLCGFIDNFDIDNVIRKFTKGSKYVFLLRIYNAMFKTFRHFENEKYYYKYKKLLLEYSDRISHTEITEHFTNIVNYCIMKNRTDINRKIFRPELMNIYEIMLGKDYYLTEKIKYLPNDLFRDVLLIGIEQKDFRWLINYVSTYSEKLALKYKENMFNYGNAYLYHKQKNYEKSQGFISKVNFDNFNYIFDMQNLSLKNYYELDYTEEALCLINTYRRNLSYNKMLSKERKNRHRNFLSYLEKIVKYKTGNTKIDINFLKHKLIEEDHIIYKEWLMGKIEEVESRVSNKI